MELVDEPVEVRPRELEAEVLDAGPEEGLALGAQRRLSAVTRVRLLALVKGGGPGRSHRRLWALACLQRRSLGRRRRHRLGRWVLLGLCCGGGGGHGGD